MRHSLVLSLKVFVADLLKSVKVRKHTYVFLVLRINSYILVYEKIRNAFRPIQGSSEKKNNERNMSQKKIPKPTESELEILQVLWENGPSSVRFVNDKLNEQREVGYTTTLKLMQIMVEKGLALRNTESRTHIYQAAVSETDTQQRLLEKFVDTAFRGSAMSLVLQALGNHKASQEELEEIKALIERMEGNEDV